MITLEQLKEWNPLYKPWDILQELNAEDLMIVRTRETAMRKLRESGKPTPGDVVECTNPYGKRVTGLLENTGRYHIGENVSGYIGEEGYVMLSGGPFWYIETIDTLKPAGTAVRRFWTFGRFGACAHGGVYFNVTVNKWILD